MCCVLCVYAKSTTGTTVSTERNAVRSVLIRLALWKVIASTETITFSGGEYELRRTGEY
jgi:hypothetical protein